MATGTIQTRYVALAAAAACLLTSGCGEERGHSTADAGPSVIVASCDGGFFYENEDIGPKPPQVVIGEVAPTEVCAALCSIEQRCNGVGRVCGWRSPCDFALDVEHPEEDRDCVYAGDEGCTEHCVRLYAASTLTEACRTADLKRWACAVGGSCEQFDSYFEESGACSDLWSAAHQACRNAMDRHTCTSDEPARELPGGELCEPNQILGSYRSGPYFWVDNYVPEFRTLLATGVCPASPESWRSIDISLGIGPFFWPHTRVGRAPASLGELINAEDFRFTALAEEASGLETNATARAESTGETMGVGLVPESIRFEWTGGEARKDDDLLVILLMDHSGSLAGVDPGSGERDVSRATDRYDLRVAYYELVVRSLPATWFVSLVPFHGTSAIITERFSRPTRDRQLIREGLMELQRGESGRTPLADALEAARCQIAGAEANAHLNPAIVLFTDGVEEGDPSTASLADVTEALATGGPCADGARPGVIPVIVLQLQATPASGHPLGRDWGLAELACRTGGEYLYFSSADELLESQRLQPSFTARRLSGTWRLRTHTTLDAPSFGPDEWAISAQLTAVLDIGNGERQSRTARLAPPEAAIPPGQPSYDSRLWIRKQ